MANEIQIRSSIRIRNGAQDYNPQPTTFSADQSVQGGPTPGQITIGVLGYEDVDLSELATPGVIRIQNMDTAEVIQYGVDTLYFGEVLPEEFYILRLSRYFRQQASGTGTAGVGALRIWGAVGTKVVVEAFEA